MRINWKLGFAVLFLAAVLAVFGWRAYTMFGGSSTPDWMKVHKYTGPKLASNDPDSPWHRLQDLIRDTETDANDHGVAVGQVRFVEFERDGKFARYWAAETLSHEGANPLPTIDRMLFSTNETLVGFYTRTGESFQCLLTKMSERSRGTAIRVLLDPPLKPHHSEIIISVIRRPVAVSKAKDGSTFFNLGQFPVATNEDVQARAVLLPSSFKLIRCNPPGATVHTNDVTFVKWLTTRIEKRPASLWVSYK